MKNRILEAIEQIRCAQVNLDLLGDRLPVLKGSPFFVLVKMQIDEAEAILTGKENSE